MGWRVGTATRAVLAGNDVDAATTSISEGSGVQRTGICTVSAITTFNARDRDADSFESIDVSTAATDVQ